VKRVPGLRVPGAFDGFELAVRAVLGQQVSVKAATTMAGRWAAAFGEPIATPWPELGRLAPTAARMLEVAEHEIGALGVIGSRARCLMGLARAVTERRVVLSLAANVEEQIGNLLELPGVGRGPRNTSPCGRCIGRMHFPTATSCCSGLRNRTQGVARARRSLAALAGLRHSLSLAHIGSSSMNSYTYVESPIGRLLLSTDGEALTGIYMHLPDGPAPEMKGWARDADAGALPDTARQLGEYFGGRRRDFDLPMRLAGTEFQRLVWKHLSDIRYGETLSYGELAKRIGNPNASRAVGLANGRNPIPILVPCIA